MTVLWRLFQYHRGLVRRYLTGRSTCVSKILGHVRFWILLELSDAVYPGGKFLKFVVLGVTGWNWWYSHEVPADPGTAINSVPYIGTLRQSSSSFFLTLVKMYHSGYGQQSYHAPPPSGYVNRNQSTTSHTNRYHGPPPGADPQLWQWFSNVDVDRSGSITVTELQSALVNGKHFAHFLQIRLY